MKKAAVAAMVALMLCGMSAQLIAGDSGKSRKEDTAMSMQKTYRFLKDAGHYFIATDDGGQPRVRPFGTVHIFEGRLYIQTGRVKAVSRQIAANPKVELCAFHEGKWLRLSGELVDDDRREPKKAILDKMPMLRGMYSEDDDNTQVLYFEDAEATFCSFGQPPEVFSL